jgi:hypothetical protein
LTASDAWNANYATLQNRPTANAPGRRAMEVTYIRSALIEKSKGTVPEDRPVGELLA